MENLKYSVILFYKYVELEDPEAVMAWQKEICKSLELKGRTLLAKEGINATLEGETESITKYIELMRQDSRFEDIIFKISKSSGQAFSKLSVKVRSEIVSLSLPSDQDYDPKLVKAKYLEPEELYNWIHQEKREFYILDMRNYYEAKVGHFAGSLIFDNLKNFRDLPNILDEIQHLKHKTILTVCTGGIRCERASGFLLQHGFTDVYQLHNGIVTYMEKYPNEDFLGKLYVFDGRVMMGFNTESPEHQVVGRCQWCGQKSENFINFNVESGERMHAICCQDCLDKGLVNPQQKEYYSWK